MMATEVVRLVASPLAYFVRTFTSGYGGLSYRRTGDA